MRALKFPKTKFLSENCFWKTRRTQIRGNSDILVLQVFFYLSLKWQDIIFPTDHLGLHEIYFLTKLVEETKNKKLLSAGGQRQQQKENYRSNIFLAKKLNGRVSFI